MKVSCQRGNSEKDCKVPGFDVNEDQGKAKTSVQLSLSQISLEIFCQALPRAPLLRGDWLPAGASRLSNMAAPSGGVNCEEFAEFQVMGFFPVAGVSFLLSPDPVPSSGLGGNADKLWKKRAIRGSFFEPLEVMGARGWP